MPQSYSQQDVDELLVTPAVRRCGYPVSGSRAVRENDQVATSSGGVSRESVLVHAGAGRVPGSPLSPPLVPASVYVSWGEPGGYGRDGNPGWEALEQALGVIEGAEAVVFASGRRPDRVAVRARSLSP
jgi:hypothetical protein